MNFACPFTSACGVSLYILLFCVPMMHSPLRLDGGQNSKTPMLMATFFGVIIHQWLKILLVSTCTDLRSRNFQHYSESLFLCVCAVGLKSVAVNNIPPFRWVNLAAVCGSRLLRIENTCLVRIEPGLCQGLMSAISPVLHWLLNWSIEPSSPVLCELLCQRSYFGLHSR